MSHRMLSGLIAFAGISLQLSGCGGDTPSGPSGATTTATRLAFVVPPAASIPAGAMFRPTILVTATDEAGKTDSSFAGDVSVALGANPSGAPLLGLLTVRAVRGVAAFPNLQLLKAGAGYTLTATAPDLASTTSARFDVVGSPQLAFTAQPSRYSLGDPIAPAVQVTARDAAGNPMPTFAGDVTITLAPNAAGGVLAGTTRVSAVNGVAIFDHLTIDKAGGGYVLLAAAPDFASGTSTAFGSYGNLVFTVQPSDVPSGSTIVPPVQVTVLNAPGITDQTFTGTVTLALGSNPGNAQVRGTTSVAAIAGVATFPNLTMSGGPASGYTLVATASRFSSGTSSGFTVLPNPWSSKAPPPSARSGAVATAVNGVVYLMGGSTGYYGETYVATVEAYDPATNTWSIRSPMPTAKAGFGIGVVDGIIYVVGGWSGTGVTATVEAYDPVTNSWTAKASMPNPRGALGVGVVNGKLYAVGGSGLTGPVGTVEAYDPVANSWSARASMPTPRSGIAVDVVGGTLYAVGGYSAAVYAYDPAADTWSSRAPMPVARGSSGVAVVNGLLYVVGGVVAGYDYEYAVAVDAYDPATNSWRAALSLPVGGPATAGVVNGVVYAVVNDVTLFAYRP